MTAVMFVAYVLLTVLKLDGYVTMSWTAILICPWVVLILASVVLNIPTIFSWRRKWKSNTVYSGPVELYYIPEMDWKNTDTSYYQSLDGRHVVRRNEKTEEWEYIRDFQTVASGETLTEALDAIPGGYRTVVC